MESKMQDNQPTGRLDMFSTFQYCVGVANFAQEDRSNHRLFELYIAPVSAIYLWSVYVYIYIYTMQSQVYPLVI